MRASGVMALPILLLACAALPVIGQATTFNPEIELEAGTEDNVFLRPEGLEVSDTSYRAEVLLPWLRAWDGGSLLFSYAPAYVKYSDLSDLDHDEHFVTLLINATPGRKSTIDYALYFENAQGEGDLRSVDTPNLMQVRRTERDVLITDFTYMREAGRRLSWSLGAGGSIFRFTELDDLAVDDTEDRDELRGVAGIYYSNSRTSRIGAEAAYAFHDLELSGQEDVSYVSFVWHRELGRDVDLDLQAGLFRRDTELEGLPESVSETGAQGHLRLAKSIRRTRLVLFAERGPSDGGAIRGTSTDTVFRIVAEGELGPRWIWSFASHYMKQDPTFFDMPDIRSIRAGAGIEWRPQTNLGFRLDLYDIERSFVGIDVDTSAFVATLGAVWYPKGPRRPVGLEE